MFLWRWMWYAICKKYSVAQFYSFIVLSLEANESVKIKSNFQVYITHTYRDSKIHIGTSNLGS